MDIFQRKMDGQLKSWMGYSASRFPRSFEETVRHFARLHSLDSEQELMLLVRAREIAERVFYQKAEEYDGIEELIAGLLKQGFRCGIVTAGEQWVQRRRLDDFRLLDRFHAVKIVTQKSADVIRQFCELNNIDMKSSYFVGDSVPSDIIPATQAGLNAILVRHPNWQEGEAQELPPSTCKPEQHSNV